MTSGRRKLWTFAQPDEETCRHLSEAFSLHPAVAAVLYNRGVRTDADVETYLRGGLDALHDPFLMKDVDRAVDRILQAAARDEKVAVYGDFDVDGLTSMHLLGRFLFSIGIECTEYVPNRLLEGYGLSRDGIESCHAEGASLLITVDCGISSVDEVAYATGLGMDVIVADHHEPEPILPDCCAVIDPKRSDCSYPFSELAGVGVVYKLCQAILEKLPSGPRGASHRKMAERHAATGSKMPTPHDLFRQMIDVVALGTVADLAPLVDENRLLVRAGLRELSTTRNTGLQELKAICKVDRRVTAYDIAFRIAPRLNAAGRMGNAESALRLLNSEDEVEAYNLASVMEENNKNRQKIEQQILREAEQQIRNEVDLETTRCLIVHSEDWHQGVTGIVASRLTKSYYRPTIILSVEGEMARATARSIPEFDLLAGLRDCREYLATFGGHRLAAGFDIHMSNFPAFKEKFERLTAEQLSADDITPKIVVDAVIDINEVCPELVASLRKLEPFGEANPQPLFVSRGLLLKSSPTVVAGRHLKALVEGRDSLIEAIGFDMADRLRELRNLTAPFDLAYVPRMNSYRGIENLQLVIKDIQPSET
jgi:single-stranded-DNA-specific exonuclease